MPDHFGADLVAFIDNGDHERVRWLHVICWQCKTGNSSSTLGPKSGAHNAASIIARFKAADITALKKIIEGQTGTAVQLTVERLVVTTCYIAPTGEARTMLKGADITLLEREHLKAMWTPRIQRFLQADPRVAFMLDS